MTRVRSRWLGTVTVTALLVGGSVGACSSTADHNGASCAAASNGVAVTAEHGAPTTPSTTDLSLNPEIATGYRSGMRPEHTGTFAVSTANPVATEAACRVLRDGGTAADALVVAQTALGLVEPQASGIGGGAFLVYYDAATRNIDAYDGRETAPAAATGDYLRWVSDSDHSGPRPNTRASGRSIGTPGVLRLLELAHHDHGKTPWRELFDPAIALADQGFAIGARLGSQIAESAADLAKDPAARAYFLHPNGTPKTVGTRLTNPAMAKTLSAVASDGPDAFYHGSIAADIAAAIATDTGGRTPGLTTVADLAAYHARKLAALCTTYRDHDICGMPPPSSGGMAVAATLGILSNFDLSAMKPADLTGDGAAARDGGVPAAAAVHLISEAERLAYADRDKYVADTDFVPLPGNSPQALLDRAYLQQRAALIDTRRSMGVATAGPFAPVLGTAAQQPEHGTSHISAVDRYGNAAAMTTTVESAFGSMHMVDGFVLNNQLTDFSAEPVDKSGTLVANRIEAGKRPRSSMAPTLVFARDSDGTRGPLTVVTGSPGGAVIIQFVVKTLVALLDWGMDPQQAVSMMDFGAANTPVTNIGGEHPNLRAAGNGDHDPVVVQLRQLGHQVSVAAQSSGASALLRENGGWIGGADPRREGIVLGDPPSR